MKETKYTFDNVKVIIHDPSSNSARRPILEKACIHFFEAVERQRRKEKEVNKHEHK